jgi:uncharacterized iron-regulated membrane protein
MFSFQKLETQKLLAIHGWSGVSLGLLLYAIVLTGAIAVFAEEIGEWSAGRNAKHHSAFEYKIDPIIRHLATQTDPKYHEEVGLNTNATGDLIAFFHTHIKNENGTPEDYGIWFKVNPETGEIREQREGTGREVFGQDGESALSRFLVDMHVRLYLPDPWGLLLTGILGVAMMIGAVSGFIMHKHLFRDIFTLRKHRSPLLAKRDMHTVAGSWGLPFAFILAFTGSFFSFVGSIGIPIMAMVAFGGDQEKMIERVLGAPPAENNTPAEAANMDALLADASSRAGVAPEFVVINHYGRADAIITTRHPSTDGDLQRRNLVYSLAEGTFLREKPNIGTTPSVGSAVLGFMGPLHFGNFAGLLSKAVWFALGFSMCYVVLTGLNLWLTRRAENPSWRFLGRLAVVIGNGLPLAIIGSCFAYFLSLSHGYPANWTPLGFVGIAVLILLGGSFVKDVQRLKWALQLFTMFGLLILPLARHLTGGPSWEQALQTGNVIIPAVDVVLFVGGLFVLDLLRRQGVLSQIIPFISQLIRQPALRGIK